MDTPNNSKNDNFNEIANLVKKAIAPYESRINELEKEIKALNRKISPDILNKKSFSLINKASDKLQAQEISYTKDKIQLHEKKIQFLYDNVVSSKKFGDYFEQLNEQIDSITKAHQDNSQKVKLFEESIKKVDELSEFIKQEVKGHINKLLADSLTRSDYNELKKSVDDNISKNELKIDTINSRINSVENQTMLFDSKISNIDNQSKFAESKANNSENQYKLLENKLNSLENQIRLIESKQNTESPAPKHLDHIINSIDSRTKVFENKVNTIEDRNSSLENRLKAFEEQTRLMINQIETTRKIDTIEIKELASINQRFTDLEKNFTDALESVYKDHTSKIKKIENELENLGDKNISQESINEQFNNIIEDIAKIKEKVYLQVEEIRQDFAKDKNENIVKFRIFQNTIPNVDVINKEIQQFNEKLEKHRTQLEVVANHASSIAKVKNEFNRIVLQIEEINNTLKIHGNRLIETEELKEQFANEKEKPVSLENNPDFNRITEIADDLQRKILKIETVVQKLMATSVDNDALSRQLRKLQENFDNLAGDINDGTSITDLLKNENKKILTNFSDKLQNLINQTQLDETVIALGQRIDELRTKLNSQVSSNNSEMSNIISEIKIAIKNLQKENIVHKNSLAQLDSVYTKQFKRMVEQFVKVAKNLSIINKQLGFVNQNQK